MTVLEPTRFSLHRPRDAGEAAFFTKQNSHRSNGGVGYVDRCGD
jgi:hypothetical protein